MRCDSLLPTKHPRQTWVGFWYALSVTTAAMLPEQAVATSAEHVSELGPVVATVSVDPLESLVGDPVTLTLTVTAEKDIDLWMPEFGEALDRFSILDFVPRQSVDDQGRIVQTQIYRLQTPSSGIQAIPPLLIEFVDQRPGQAPTPPDQDAYELLTERVEFHVISVLPDGATADLHPPLGELPLQDSAQGRLSTGAITGLVVGVVCIGGALCFYAWLAMRRRARRQTAYEIASRKLKRLLETVNPTGINTDKFFVELSGIVRRYLEDRFELRAPELTTEEFLAAVSASPDLSLAHQRLLREFLRQADLVKFAGVLPNEQDIQQSIDRARQFLDETQENAPYVTVATGQKQVA